MSDTTIESISKIKKNSNEELPSKITTMSEYEKRMEVNRLRAKEIRKRKKKMEEDMRQQIVQLTLENNRLRIQNKMQNVEIDRLRKERYQQQSMMMFNQQGVSPLMQLGIQQPAGALGALGGLPGAAEAGLVNGDVESVHQQMLASIAASGEDSAPTGSSAPSTGGITVPQSNASIASLGGTPSPNQVEAALMYDQALLRQVAGMHGVGGAARMMSLQNQQAATRGGDSNCNVSFDQNQQIISLLSDRSLSVQEGILKKLQEQSDRSK